MDNDKRVVKYRTQIRKCCINIQAWQENNPNPNDKEAKELDVLGGRLKDAIFYYREHIRQGNWVKHSYVSEPIDESRLGLDQTKLIEHNEYLEKTQGVPADEDVIVGGN